MAGALGPVPTPMVPTVQDVGPTQQIRGFMPMPMSNTGVVQRTSPGQMQSTSPTPSAAPPAAPPTVHTAEVSNVPGIYITLSLLHICIIFLTIRN